MANKKGNANKTPSAKAPDAAETETVAADPVADAAGDPELDLEPGADAAGDPPDPGDDTATDPVVESKPVIEDKAPTGADKKTADKNRREAAIAEHQEAVADAPVDEEFEAVEERKAAIVERMGEIDDEVGELDLEINTLRDEGAELLLELYPQQGESDKHAVAVRGYLSASARERKHRSLAPARLKKLLQKAGLAPIDAAFSRARGRGMTRPIRKVRKKATKSADKTE